MYQNNFKSGGKKRLIIYLLICVFGFVLGWQATMQGFLGKSQEPKDQKISELITNKDKKEDIDLNLFWTVWGKIEGQYIKEEMVEEKNMIYGAIRGMVDSLDDPYSIFMTPEETKEFSASLEGRLEGIGAELTIKDKNLIIVTPLRASPAERAGLLPKDIIYKINGELASEMTLFQAVMNIRGKKGTTVTLTIIREGVDNPFDVTIVRESIDIESVTVENLEGDIVYLGVNQFNDKTNDEFGKAISKLILSEPKGVIVDLRFNGGGYLDIAVELLSYLLPTDTEAVLIKEKNKSDVTMRTNGKPKLLKTPLVVLVNESSASASEIVAGAIQDHQRGIVMGATTFGKGNVQEVDTFFDGSSLRMTIAKWYTPQGRSIEEVGITPDILVEITEEDIENEYDRQKETAIEYLKNL